jgi:regulator of protease activity HflC (stomatin/prohibitin superfamily)
MNFLLVIGALIVAFIATSVKIMNEYERGVVFRLGRILGVKGPGMIIIIPGLDKFVKMDLRTVTLTVPQQEIITRDNVPVAVNAVAYFRVLDPQKAILEVENYYNATSQISQTTLRAVLGQVELDDLLTDREKLNKNLQEIIDKQTSPWGVKVSAVEIKDVELPQEMKRSMAKQAEAERERRAKVINADGEYQAAQKLSEAADIMAKNPITLQLRYLQTLAEIATENNSTTIFPVPIDILSSFQSMMGKK